MSDGSGNAETTTEVSNNATTVISTTMEESSGDGETTVPDTTSDETDTSGKEIMHGTLKIRVRDKLKNKRGYFYTFRDKLRNNNMRSKKKIIPNGHSELF